MTGGEKLAWSNGPEAASGRWGCVKYATWGKHRWEIHRVYERSLISGSGRVLNLLDLGGLRALAGA